MIIRWLGAFDKAMSLPASLSWEMKGEVHAVAAERLISGKSMIRRTRVGLLVKNSAVIRRYRSDVWSMYTEKGLLLPTRKEGKSISRHTECICRPEYIGIVVRGRITPQAWRACRAAAKEHNLPLFVLRRKGGLKAV